MKAKSLNPIPKKYRKPILLMAVSLVLISSFSHLSYGEIDPLKNSKWQSACSMLDDKQTFSRVTLEFLEGRFQRSLILFQDRDCKMPLPDKETKSEGSYSLGLDLNTNDPDMKNRVTELDLETSGANPSYHVFRLDQNKSAQTLFLSIEADSHARRIKVITPLDQAWTQIP